MSNDELRQMRYSSDCATAIITMVSVCVRMPGSKTFHVYAAPWDCLETAKKLADAGAASVMLSPFQCGDWFWDRPFKACKRTPKCTEASS